MRYFLLLLLFPLCIHAQSPDVRLTPDPFVAVLPAESQIQSAARIDSVTLAVWGSTVLEGGASFPVLVMQRVRGNTPLDSAQVLTVEGARPTGYVQVMAMHDRFLVVWNDRRAGATGVYAVTVDTAGVVGEERQLMNFYVNQSYGMSVLASLNRTTLTFIDTATSRTHFVRLDSSGAVVRRDTLDGIAADVRFIPQFLPAALILWHDAGTPPALYDPTSGLIRDLDTMITSRLIHPYHLSDDGEFAIYRGDTLTVYASLLDSVPLQRVGAPSALSSRDTVLLSRRASGEYQIDYPQIILTHPLDSYESYIYSRRRIVVNDTGYTSHGICGEEVIGGYYLTYPRIRYLSHSFESQCGGGHLLRLGFHVSRSAYVDGPVRIDAIEQDIPIHIGVDAEGNTMQGVGAHACTASPARVLCPAPGVVAIRRIYDRGVSIVQVSSDSDVFVQLSYSTVSPWQSSVVTATQPGLTLIGDSLILSWRSGEGALRSGVMPITQQPASGPFVARWDSLANLSLSRWTQSSSSSFLWFTAQRFACVMPTPDGWRFADPAPPPSDRTFFNKLVNGYDPDRKEWVAGSMMSLLPNEYHVVAAGIDGTVRWRADSAMAGGIVDATLVPIDSAEWLAFTAAGVTRHRGNERIATWPLPDDPALRNYVHNYHALLGPTFLRYVRTGSGIVCTLFQPADTGLVRVRHQIVSLGYQPNWVTVVQNPGDSAIILLWQSVEGVRMMHLSRLLDVSITNERISMTTAEVANVTAAVRNDTLFFAWEDRRDPVQQIYGNSRALTRLIASTPREGDEAVQSLSLDITPLPAADYIDVRLHGTNGPAAVRLVSRDGREVWRGDDVRSQVRIPTAGLAAGVYIVEVQSGAMSTRRPIVVVR